MKMHMNYAEQNNPANSIYAVDCSCTFLFVLLLYSGYSYYRDHAFLE